MKILKRDAVLNYAFVQGDSHDTAFRGTTICCSFINNMLNKKEKNNVSENQEVAARVKLLALSGDTNTPTKQNTDWKANLSDEIRNEKSLENISDIESLAKGYVHAQRLVGADKIPVPNKFATEEDWNKVYEKLGRPKSADEYKFNLPEDKTVDEAALKSFAEQAHKLGLLPGQADGLLNFIMI